jgi:hypothetical protein
MRSVKIWPRVRPCEKSVAGLECRLIQQCCVGSPTITKAARSNTHARGTLRYEIMADEILEIADDGTNDWMERQQRNGSIETVTNKDHLERSRQRIDARKWLLSKALPKKYGDKQTIDGKFSVDWAMVAQEAADKYKKKHGS